MEDRHKHSLRANRILLAQGLDLDGSILIDYLISKGILNKLDQSRLRCEMIEQKRTILLLDILSHKSDPKAFQIFLDGLDHTKQWHLIAPLQEQAKLWNENKAIHELKTWLNDVYIEDEKCVTSFEEICLEAAVSGMPVDPGGSRVRTAIKAVFTDAILEGESDINLVCSQVRNISRRGNQEKIFDDIHTEEHNRIENAKESSNGTTEAASNQLADKKPKMIDWDIQQVCDWLANTDLPHKTKTAASTVFTDQDISGDILIDCSTFHMPVQFQPTLTVGMFGKILKERDKWLQAEAADAKDESATSPGAPAKPLVIHARKFGIDSTLACIYETNAKMPYGQTSVNDSMLMPLHQYVDLSQTEEEQATFTIITNLLAFICACMNNRSNGTIHFGVSSEGFVHGFALDPARMQKYISRSLSKCFLADQIDTIKMCVQRPQFIKVDSSLNQEEERFVLEVDVIPWAKTCRDTAFYVRLPRDTTGKKLQPAAIYRFTGDQPKALDDKEIIEFAEEKSRLYQRREFEERQITQVVNREYLRDRLVQLLCQGDDSMSADLYHILVLGPTKPDIDRRYLKENLAFVTDIEWKAVFDFDPSGTYYKYMAAEQKKNVRVMLLDDYDRKVEAPKSYDDLEEELRHSAQMLWIFSNGYTEREFDAKPLPRDWKRERGNAFQEALRFIANQIAEERAVVVFALPSDDIGALTEGAYDCCDKFPDQYVILSEQEHFAEQMKTVLVQRNLTSEETANERTVTGIPWYHIQAVVQEITHSSVTEDLRIPSSSGAYCALDEYLKNGWTDIQVLGSNHCDCVLSIVDDNEAREKHRREVEENFFKGREVCWWNFYFKDQVMQRHIHNHLDKMVRDGLKGSLKSMDDDDRVARVILYHQAGAGGTTVAKNILWDLRKMYRCAVVLSVTDRTADHILELRQFKEDAHAKPVLVLLDNPEDERVAYLVSLVEKKSKHDDRYNKDYNTKRSSVACIFLVCKRATELPRHAYGAREILRQELKRDETDWLVRTYKRLNEQYTDAQGINPKYLISFNILKAGFDRGQIRATAKELLKDIDKPKERLILKYLAFLNVHDLQRRAVPAAVFNYMMQENLWIKKKCRSKGGYGSMVSQARHWELGLSETMKILLNETSRTTLGHIKAIGLIHTTLAEEVLTVLAETEQGIKQTTSEIALEFLNCKEIFNQKNHAKRDLLRLVQDIIKQRDKTAYGFPATKFSPLIEKIDKTENPERALDVYQKGYELTDDAFVAQQIARYFIKYKNWPKAEEFARKATEKVSNSYLWDTYAQVFREQVMELYNRLIRGSNPIGLEEMAQVIDLTSKAMKMFKKEQEISDMETSSHVTNDAGFFGEMRVFTTMLHCMTYCEAFSAVNLTRAKDIMQELIAQRKVPTDLRGLEHMHGNNYVEILREMWKKVQETLTRLEDEQVQLRESYIDDVSHSHRRQANQDLEKIKRDLDSYFGEDSDDVPDGLEDADACSFRRRRIFRLTGISLRDVFEMQKRDEDGLQILKRVHRLLLENIKSENQDADDLRMILNSTLALVSYGAEHLYKISYEDVVGWTRILYGRRDTLKFNVLEPYLYYTMMNWPRKNAKAAVPPSELKEVLRQWMHAYCRKYPRQREDGRLHRKKDTVMFFFANGSEMNSIVSYSEINRQVQEEGQRVRSRFWRRPFVLRRLERFSGTLNSDGDKVNVPVRYMGNQYTIDLPTSLPIRDYSMYNKNVWFVIGFSWAGPKAYDIDVDDPTMDEHAVAKGHTNPDPRVRPGESTSYWQNDPSSRGTTHWEFLEVTRNAEAELEKIRRERGNRAPTKNEKKEERRLLDFIKRKINERLEQPLSDAQ